MRRKWTHNRVGVPILSLSLTRLIPLTSAGENQEEGVPRQEPTRSPLVNRSSQGSSKKSDLGTVYRINSNRPFRGVLESKGDWEVGWPRVAKRLMFNSLNKCTIIPLDRSMVIRETDRRHARRTADHSSRTRTTITHDRLDTTTYVRKVSARSVQRTSNCDHTE